ncbi:MAG TPA: cell division protein FtsZ [Solirubrobacterales bacterium]|nr:cell division protein FtsZ [Solirubrobacterales bacterium]
MARKKRASMREGPLADLFRSTEESVGPDEVNVTANGAGTARVEVAVEEPQPVQETPRTEPVPEPTPEPVPEPMPDPVPEPLPGPEPVPEPTSPDPVAETKIEEPEPEITVERVEVHHEGLERLMGGPGTEIRPAFGREEPDTSSPTRQPVVPRTHQAVLRVVGVGGAGVNAVNRMVEAELPGVEFLAINTDLQSLQNSNADVTLHIGAELTRGLGSGSDPRVGYRAAYEEQDKIKELLKGSDMVFLASGSGGGTGTGAAPVVAKLARDIGALTVAAVTKPFSFEGARRAAQAEEGIAALGKEVDTMIVVPNERLLTILERRTSIVDAFKVADDVLRQAVQGVSDLVMLPGLINLDFADVRTTMIEAGDAILGIGMGYGEHRATIAAEKAVSSPLLETSVEGAHSLLLSITGGPDLSLIEASEAAEIVRAAAHPEAEIIFGASVDEDMSEEVWITVIATRFDTALSHRFHRRNESREPRIPDRDAALRPERYADPVGDWRERDPAPRRNGRADELYGDGVWGRNPARQPTQPRSLDGRVLDVPEFKPGP